MVNIKVKKTNEQKTTKFKEKLTCKIRKIKLWQKRELMLKSDPIA